jgi:hypothetical protein
MAPTFQAVGTAVASTGASVNVSWPTHLADDIGLLIIETSGDSATLTPPSGWDAIPGTPVTDVATTAGSKLHVWWKRATSASEVDVATGTATDHIIARLYTFRGCITTGNPWNVTTTGTKTTASSTATVPALVTTLDDTLITMIVGRPNDNSSTTHFGVPVNSNLTGLAEAGEAGTANGNGGGFVVSYGVESTPSNTGTSTLTKSASTTDTYVVLALKATTELIGTTVTYALAGTTTGLLFNRKLDTELSKFFLPERNLVRYSEQFENAYWQKNLTGTGLAPVVTANDATAPDGTLTADKIVFDLNGGTTIADRSDISSSTATPAVVGRTYIFSVWLKTTDGSSKVVQFSHNGAVTSLVTVTGTWQRFTSTSNTAADTTRRPRIGLRGATGTDAFASLHIWGCQWEEGTSITDYDPTGAVGASVTNLSSILNLNLNVEAFSLNGVNNDLLFNRNLDQQTGTFTVAGVNTTLLNNRLLDLSTQAFTVTGIDTNLQYNPLVVAYSLDGIVCPFTVIGSTVGLNLQKLVSLTTGTFVLSGATTSFQKQVSLSSLTGTFNIGLNPTALNYSSIFYLTPATFTTRLQSNGDFFWYRTTQTIQPAKYRLTNRNQWILGRATHMGRRGI